MHAHEHARRARGGGSSHNKKSVCIACKCKHALCVTIDCCDMHMINSRCESDTIKHWALRRRPPLVHARACVSCASQVTPGPARRQPTHARGVQLTWVRRCLVPKSKVATRLSFNLPSPPLTLFAGAKQGDAGGDQGAEAFRAIEGVGSRRAGRVGAPWSAGGMSKSKVATRLDLTV